MNQMDQIAKINKLKREKNAAVLVHNYQRPEMYKIADFVGDSLELSRKAAETHADMIVFCGVRFMAETAKILNPEKKVLLPSLEAGCSLAGMATVEQLTKMKERYPAAAVVSYINTSAEVKALSDICCTSANAVKIINSLPHDEVIFLPDQNLARYVQSKTNKKIIAWNGYCSVHQELRGDNLLQFKEEHPRSKIIAHPECREDILKVADYVCGTGGMAAYAEREDSMDFIVVTECGMTNKLRDDVPGKNFFSFCNFCSYMKVTTLDLTLQSLHEEKYPIELPQKTLVDAKSAIIRMLEVAP